MRSTMVLSLTLLSLTLLSLAACGPDADLIASGKAHSCRLQKATAGLARTPHDEALSAEVREATKLLQAVIETADEGKRAQLGKAIADAVSEGCE